MDLDAVTDELYGGTPETFTTTRTAREKEAKQAGEAEVAAAIHGLTKPTVAAWLANQLSRERPEDVAALVEIGSALREATAALRGDDFRELTTRQQKLVRDLVRQAKQLAATAGKIIGETTAREVEDTLRAAVLDASAGEELIQGGSRLPAAYRVRQPWSDTGRRCTGSRGSQALTRGAHIGAAAPRRGRRPNRP